MEASHRRTKTGCLTCRVRRKKCDEAKPVCTGCERNKLICSWPTKAKLGPEAPHSQPTGDTERRGSGSRPEDVTTACRANSSQCRGVLSLFLTHTMSTLPHQIELMPILRRQADKHFFDHYMNVTAVRLAGRPSPQNAFLTHLIPVAYHDARLVQCLLALSGAQLCYQSSEQFEHGARSHYAVTLRNVKHSLLSWKSLDAVQLVGLLWTTLLLCYFEILIGNTDGSFFHHLRASRTILIELRENRASQIPQSLRDTLTEIYSYFAITTNLTINTDLPVSRDIPEDAFLSPMSLVELNKGKPIYGVLFGCAHELFGLIMPILRSARYFHEHKNTRQRDINIRKYEQQINAWTFKPELFSSKHDDSDDISDHDDDDDSLVDQLFAEDPDLHHYKLAGEAYQQILLVFLYTAFHNAQAPSSSLTARIDTYILRALELGSQIPFSSPIWTTMSWTAFIAGSCTRNPELRELMVQNMQGVSLELLPQRKNVEFLKLVWEEMDRDESVYGLWGLEKTMRKRGWNVTSA